jgi:hypothetical protein
VPYVSGCEDAWRAGFLKHRRPVQLPAIKIKSGKQEATGVALQASSEPVRVRIGADQDEQCCGRLGSFAAGCQVTHRNGFEPTLAVNTADSRIEPNADIGCSFKFVDQVGSSVFVKLLFGRS